MYEKYSKYVQDALNIDQSTLKNIKISVEEGVEYIKKMHGVRADSVTVCHETKRIYFIQEHAFEFDTSSIPINEDGMVIRSDYDLDEANRLFALAEQEYREIKYQTALKKMNSKIAIDKAIGAALKVIDQALAETGMKKDEPTSFI